MGGLHTITSFLGSVGNLRNGTGLSELLTTIYAESSVLHILSVKVNSGALRAHFFVHAALMTKLIDAVLPPDADQLSSPLSVSADVAEGDEEEIIFAMEVEFASVENEGEILDIGMQRDTDMTKLTMLSDNITSLN